MKTKLTLTIEKDLIPRVKKIAAARAVSLSQLVETHLKALDQEEKESFSSRWRGRFEPAGRNDPRYDALAEKYL